jgi:BED zinc finger
LVAPPNTGFVIRQHRSEIWNHFRKADDYEVSKKTICMRCGKTFRSACGSTTTMRTHLMKNHPGALTTHADAESLSR